MQFSTIPLIDRAESHGGRTAIIASDGTFNYYQLLESSARVAQGLLDGKDDLQEKRVAFLVPRGFEYDALQWGIWRAGGIAVPLGEIYPPAELDYVIGDSDATIVVAHPEFYAQLSPLAESRQVRFLPTDELLYSSTGPLPRIDSSRRAMILYTSGTTGKLLFSKTG